MKTNLSQRNNHRDTLSLFGACVAVLVLAVGVFGFDRLTHGLVRASARVAGSTLWMAAAGVAHVITDNGILSSKRALVAENNSLKATIAQQEEYASYITAIQEEHTTLARMVHLLEDDPHGITARVLSSFRTSPYGTFIIGAGTVDGVGEGNYVLSAGGIVLGTVTSVSARSATVTGVFAPGTTIDVIDGALAFSLEGRGGGNAKAEIPRDAHARVADILRAPIFHDRAVGVIGAIESASSSATQTIYVRTSVNLDTLMFVYVTPN